MSINEKYLQSPLKGCWQRIQLGILLLPLFPTWGCVITLIGVFSTWKYCYKSMVKQPINQGLSLVSLLFLITALLSEYPLNSLLGLSNFIPYFIVFAAFSELIQTPNQLRRLSWILIIPVIPIIILGVGQQFLGWSGGDNIQGILGWTLQLNGNPPGRMASVFMYANILAAYLLLVFTLSLGLLIEKFPVILNTQFKTQVKSCFFLGLVVILTGMALIITYSRNAWGLMVIIILAYGIYCGWRGLVGLILSGILAVLGAAFAPSPLNQGLRFIIPAYFWQRLTDQNFERPIETLRVTQWQFAWNLTQQRPWIGWGFRSFTTLYQEKMNVWMGHPHNLFLMLTAEVGIPATLFFVGIVGWILTQFVQCFMSISIHPSDRLILFSYGLAFGVYTLFNWADVTIFDFRVNTLAWLLLGAIWSNTRYLKNRKEQD